MKIFYQTSTALYKIYYVGLTVVFTVVCGLSLFLNARSVVASQRLSSLEKEKKQLVEKQIQLEAALNKETSFTQLNAYANEQGYVKMSRPVALR